MVWISEEYAAEAAVVSTWVAALVPWSVSYTSDAPFESIVYFLRLPLFDLQVRFPAELSIEGRTVDVAPALAEQYGGVVSLSSVHLGLPPLQLGGVEGPILAAYALWTVAAVLMLGTLGLSIATYLREDQVRSRLPVEFVRLTAIALGAVSALLAGATVAFALSDAAYGTPLPIGVLIVGALSVALFRAERRGDAAA